MSRLRSFRLALALLSLPLLAWPAAAQVVVTQSSATPAQSVSTTVVCPAPAVPSGLPLVKDGAISALLLEGGLLVRRVDGGSPSWIFAFGGHDGESSQLHVSVFADGSDTGLAIGSLTRFYRFAPGDLRILKAYANGADLSKTDGKWTGLTKQEAYDLAADPKMGALGGRLKTALAFFDSLGKLDETASSLVATGTGLCGAAQAIGKNASGSAGSANAAATASASVQYDPAAYAVQSQLLCASGWPPPRGTTPAFPPAAPPFSPPTNPAVFAGTGCGLDDIGLYAPCVTGAGQLCTCTCQAADVGPGATWATPVACTNLPFNPGAGVPGGPGACSPIGGTGPCSDAAGTQCHCSCVAGPAGTGVWGTPSCGSGSASLALLFGLLATIVVYRRRAA